jgi:2-polyprenyl-3-methyl-5-hydroxy-6-metoxy-1,4-benzoquinol methylase
MSIENQIRESADGIFRPVRGPDILPEHVLRGKPISRFAITRNLQPEWMDDPAIDPIEHSRALAGLARLNRFSGVAGRTFRCIQRLTSQRLLPASHPRRLRILDVASGSGDVPIAWVRMAKRFGIEFEITMLDISPMAISQQQRLAREHDVHVTSIQMNCLTESLPTGFDVVTNSLFMHHLEVEDASQLLRNMRAASDHAIVVCDLDRSRWNIAAVTIAGQLLTRSKTVHHDGPQSVRGAFTQQEFGWIGEKSLGMPMQIQSAFPCRFIAYHVL